MKSSSDAKWQGKTDRLCPKCTDCRMRSLTFEETKTNSENVAENSCWLKGISCHVSKGVRRAPLFWTVKFVAFPSRERASTWPHGHCSVAIWSPSCMPQHLDGLRPTLQGDASALRSERKLKDFIKKQKLEIFQASCSRKTVAPALRWILDVQISRATSSPYTHMALAAQHPQSDVGQGRKESAVGQGTEDGRYQVLSL